MAQDLLGHKLESIRAITRAEAEVRGALARSKGGIVELKRFAPWKQYLIPSRAKFVVYPSQRGGYCAQGVPQRFGTQALRVPFPAEWAGAPEEELPAISGIETLKFCHAGRFLDVYKRQMPVYSFLKRATSSSTGGISMFAMM